MSWLACFGCLAEDADIPLTSNHGARVQCAGVTELSYQNMAKVVAHEVSKVIAGQPPTIQLNTIQNRLPQTQSIGL